MRRIFLPAVIAVVVSFFSLPVLADDGEKAIGLWKMTTNMNGYFECSNLEIHRDGTGSVSRFATAQMYTEDEFRWKIQEGIFHFYYPEGELRRARIRFENSRSLILTPVGPDLKVNGPELRYKWQAVRDPSGC